MSSTLDALHDPERLDALRLSGLLDSLPEETFDRLTRLATRLLGAPTALVSLVTNERQFFKSDEGLAAPWCDLRETPLSHSFCQHVVQTGEPFVVEDARGHPLVCDNLAIPDIGVVAYAGFPLTLSDGKTLGSLCVIDSEPREWREEDLEGLRDLAAVAAAEVEARVRTAEKAEAARALEELNERFRATFEQAAVGIAHVGRDGRWLRVNRRLCELVGYSREELLGMTFQELTHPEDLAWDLDELERLRRGESRSYQMEKRYIHRDGHDVWTLLTVSLVRDEAGRVDYFIAVVEEIDELKTTELELRRTADRLRETQVEVLDRLTQAAEFRDDDTGLHTRRVGDLSARIAAELGWPGEQVSLLRRAATLHDVGKIGISDLILLKPGRLTPEEYARMKEHARIGGRILAHGRSELIRMAEEIALAHHERWDGSGYPAGSRGEEIPPAARIVAVADVFDALAHDRPYRPALPLEQVVEEIRRLSGAHFDPQVVDAFLRVRAGEEGPLTPGAPYEESGAP